MCKRHAARALPCARDCRDIERRRSQRVRLEHDKRREKLAADLVVDATGRGDPTVALLESLGKPLPQEVRLGVDLGYSTALFAIPHGASQDWKWA